MALFKRKKTTTALPDLDWYNKVEKKERSRLAWFLAVAAIAGACALLIGLFFGGRWLYRHNKAQNKPTTIQEEPAKPSEETTAPASDTPAPSTTPTATTPSTTPVADPNLANTGPADTLAIFLSVTLLSVIAYQFKLRKI
jgi:cytoskeletal protein RodZ